MSKINKLNALAASVVVGALGAGAVQAASSPFAATEIPGGTMQLAGEGSCGGSKKAEGNCGGDKAAPEGKCGEGKCGEGKCGAEMKSKAKVEGKCGEGKCGAEMKSKAKVEGKCGEGKCGADMMKPMEKAKE